MCRPLAPSPNQGDSLASLFLVASAVGVVMALTLFGCADATPPRASQAADVALRRKAPRSVELDDRAVMLARELIIVDGHIDLPYRLQKTSIAGVLTEDISRPCERGDFDLVRSRRGGLDAAFMAIYVPVKFEADGVAKRFADTLIDIVHELVRQNPDRCALANSPAEVVANAKSGKLSMPLGIENGSALEGRIANVEHFKRRGVQYITLTHSRDNALGDSSSDTTRTHHGLSAFGRQVVTEMNRLGMMVDVSHASDETALQACEASLVPVIASHSALRHFVPDLQRNMSDEVLRCVARRGGLVMISFGSEFLTVAAAARKTKRREAERAYATEARLDTSVVEDRTKAGYVDAKLPMLYASVRDAADHVDHARAVAGIDHVGIGSDFEGVGDSLPTGLKDVSQYPNLVRELLQRGYSEEELRKILADNIFRVWQTVLEQTRVGEKE